MLSAAPTMKGEFVSSSVSHPSTTFSPIMPIALKTIDTPSRRNSASRRSESWKMAAAGRLPYCIGENAVGRMTVVVTFATMGPFFSLSPNTRARSGSLANPSNFVMRSSRLSHASR